MLRIIHGVAAVWQRLTGRRSFVQPEVAQRARQRLRIIGVGNPYEGDGAIGVEVVRRLAREKAATVSWHEMPYPGVELLEEFLEDRPLVFVDGVDDGQVPGTVSCTHWSNEMPHLMETPQVSLHSASICEVLLLARETGYPVPPLHFITISVAEPKPEAGLSSVLARRLPAILTRVRHEVACLLEHPAFA